MSKEEQDARKELDEILAGLMTDKKMKQSDKQIIAGSLMNQNLNWINGNQKAIDNKKSSGIYNNWQSQMDKWRQSESGQKTIKEVGKKTSISMKGKNSKIIITPAGEFASLTEASLYYKICKRTLSERMEYYPDQYYYKDKGPGQPRVIHNKFMTEYGPVKSKVAAYQMAKENGNQTALDINSIHYWFDTMCKLYPKKYYKL
jgi:hypothetical protein